MNTQLWSFKQNRPYSETEAQRKPINGVAILTDTAGVPLVTRVR